MGRESEGETSRNLVLIGGRGCGKSSVARRILQERKELMLFSVDALIRYEAGGRTIPEIVEEEGWASFREREFEVIDKLGRFRGGALIDCGGGAVVDLDDSGHEVYSKRKVEALRRNGFVIYLERDVEYLMAKIAGDANRPSLSDVKSFEEIMARRDPWYREAAHVVLGCGDRSKRAILKSVLAAFDEADPMPSEG